MKAVLVIDKMPTACDECKFETEMLNCGKPMCVATPYRRERIEDDSTRPSWCPLKNLPQEREFGKQNILPIKVDGNSFVLGWNACLKDITGENE